MATVIPIRRPVHGYTPLNAPAHTDTPSFPGVPLTQGGAVFNLTGTGALTGTEDPGTQAVIVPGTSPTPTYASVYGNEPLEYPAPGNIPPSTSPYAEIDPTTGQVVNPLVGGSALTGITAWIQANPWLSLAIAAGVVYWLATEFGGFGGRRR